MKRFTAIVSFLLLSSIISFAHVIPADEIVEYLNSKEVKEAAGVERASMDKKLPRLLIIEVNKHWFELSENDRIAFAKKWHAIWRHTVPTGSVAVLDAEKGEPVVAYHPSGRVDILK